MPPPRGRRGTRSNGAGKFTAVEDFARYSEKAVQEGAAAAGKEGDKEDRPPPPGRRGTRISGARKYTTVEDLARYSVDAAEGDKE